MTTEAIAQTLGKNGLCICPDFLSTEALHETVTDLTSLLSLGLFKQAGIGKDLDRAAAATGRARNDNTYWLERQQPNPVQDNLWRLIDELRLSLNRILFLGLNDFEGHYAIYPQGGFYQRHLDSFRGDSRRIVSFVLYLNSEWKETDGGELRIYSRVSPGSAHETFTDVLPIGGTLVCFLSQEAEHEVLLSHRSRLSLTGWFKRS